MIFFMHFIHIFAQTFNETAGKGNDANNPTTPAGHCILYPCNTADVTQISSSYSWQLHHPFAWSYSALTSSALGNPGWRAHSRNNRRWQHNTVKQIHESNMSDKNDTRLPANFSACIAASKWSKGHHDVNIVVLIVLWEASMLVDYQYVARNNWHVNVHLRKVSEKYVHKKHTCAQKCCNYD